MIYNFINKFGEIETTLNLREFGKIHGFKSLTWETLNTWKPCFFSKENKNFLDKYNLKHSVFNIACLQKLGRVFIYENSLKELQRRKD